jgi:hypothetical protein
VPNAQPALAGDFLSINYGDTLGVLEYQAVR